MPASVLPRPSPDELDDLIYFSRANDLDSLRRLTSRLCEDHGSTPSTILATAIDVDEDGLGSRSCLLHWPAANGNLEVLQYLLSLLGMSMKEEEETATTTTAENRGGPPPMVNHQNVSGNTPLHWAALNGHLDCVKALVGAGADPRIRNAAGRDAVYEAECSGKDGGAEVAGWLLASCKGLESGVMGQVAEAEEAAAADEQAMEGEAVSGDGQDNVEGVTSGDTVVKIKTFV